VPGLALDLFEPQVEAYVRARMWREWQFRGGFRPGRGLVTLYDEDFRDFTSRDLWADLQAATPDDPRQLTRLSAVFAAAYVEGQTRDFAVSTTRVQAGARVTFEDTELPWRVAPARWPLLADVPRRHELESAWRQTIETDLNPSLERWHEAQRAQLPALGAGDWNTFWAQLRGQDQEISSRLATYLLESTADVYGHGLGIYLAQLDLPIDDVWRADADWAFRAARFDATFGERGRVPFLLRTFGDFGVAVLEQTDLHTEYVEWPGVACLALDVPREIRLQLRLGGGWQDYANSLRGLGMAQHLLHTDPSLRVWERWLGDETPTLAYGLLFEGLLRDPLFLAQRLDYAASDDFRVIAHLSALRDLRAAAAGALYEQRLWAAEPGSAMARDYEESLSVATRIRHFPELYIASLQRSPWSMLGAATRVRADVFAAQLRAFLRREFDEEWWRSARAAHFVADELWRPGRRHTAEELLGYMGYEGYAPAILAAEFEEVLRPL
jgi:hypothetical protein